VINKGNIIVLSGKFRNNASAKKLLETSKFQGIKFISKFKPKMRHLCLCRHVLSGQL
jgi:hypothetical protein